MKSTKISKVLIVTYEFPPIVGGAGIYAFDLSIGLSSNQCKVDIATYNHGPKSREIRNSLKDEHNIRVYDFNPRKFLHFIQFMLLIRNLLRVNKYDIIILSDGRAKRVVALFGFYFRRYVGNSISIFHGNEINLFFRYPSFAIRIAGLRKRLRKLFLNQRLLITVSKNEEKLWKHFLPDLAGKIILVNHGVNEKLFYSRTDIEKEKLKRQFNISMDKFVLLTASRLVREKGQDNLLRAYSILLQRYPQSILLIVGDGNYLDKLKGLAKKLNIENEVKFIGEVDRRILSEYYGIADIFVLLSRFEESFGLVYLEAAACGVPSISGNRGGVADAVINDETGLLVDPLNIEDIVEKINLLLSNQSFRKELGKNALYRFRKSFTCTIMANNLIQHLNTM